MRRSLDLPPPKTWGEGVLERGSNDRGHYCRGCQKIKVVTRDVSLFKELGLLHTTQTRELQSLTAPTFGYGGCCDGSKPLLSGGGGGG